jgi:hypothetical protein
MRLSRVNLSYCNILSSMLHVCSPNSMGLVTFTAWLAARKSLISPSAMAGGGGESPTVSYQMSQRSQSEVQTIRDLPVFVRECGGSRSQLSAPFASSTYRESAAAEAILSTLPSNPSVTFELESSSSTCTCTLMIRCPFLFPLTKYKSISYRSFHLDVYGN